VTDDGAQITTLLEPWASAVPEGDLDLVLTDHADDIVVHEHHSFADAD
jgi:ketosteroid isomerase-like protein